MRACVWLVAWRIRGAGKGLTRTRLRRRRFLRANGAFYKGDGSTPCLQFLAPMYVLDDAGHCATLTSVDYVHFDCKNRTSDKMVPLGMHAVEPWGSFQDPRMQSRSAGTPMGEALKLMQQLAADFAAAKPEAQAALLGALPAGEPRFASRARDAVSCAAASKQPAERAARRPPTHARCRSSLR